MVVCGFELFSRSDWNLDSLLGLSYVPAFSQVPLLVLDYRWSHNLPTYSKTVTPKWYRTHTVPKFDLQSSWITGACHYIQHKGNI